jgi:hypothetical protein
VYVNSLTGTYINYIIRDQIDDGYILSETSSWLYLISNSCVWTELVYFWLHCKQKQTVNKMIALRQYAENVSQTSTVRRYISATLNILWRITI